MADTVVPPNLPYETLKRFVKEHSGLLLPYEEDAIVKFKMLIAGRVRVCKFTYTNQRRVLSSVALADLHTQDARRTIEKILQHERWYDLMRRCLHIEPTMWWLFDLTPTGIETANLEMLEIWLADFATPEFEILDRVIACIQTGKSEEELEREHTYIAHPNVGYDGRA